MPTLSMYGSFELTDWSIDENVEKTSAGNYALGYRNDDNVFVVKYVGRSDTDVNDRLHDWVGEVYKRFKYLYASSPKSAFEKECRNYHDFGGSVKLDNRSHPDRPNGSSWECPVCTIFD